MYSLRGGGTLVLLVSLGLTARSTLVLLCVRSVSRMVLPRSGPVPRSCTTPTPCPRKLRRGSRPLRSLTCSARKPGTKAVPTRAVPVDRPSRARKRNPNRDRSGLTVLRPGCCSSTLMTPLCTRLPTTLGRPELSSTREGVESSRSRMPSIQVFVTYSYCHPFFFFFSLKTKTNASV